MRIATFVMALVVAWSAGLAHAQPRGRAPTAAQQAKLEQLDKELLQYQMKQASFAAAKVARELYLLQRKISGADAPPTQRRKQTLASALTQIGDLAAAQRLYAEILKSTEKQHGAESREVLYAIMPLAGGYWGQNRLGEAVPLYQRMLAITKKLDGENSIAYAQQLTQYGAVLQARNEYSSAQRIYERSLAIQEALAPSKDAPALIAPIQMLGSLYWQTNQRAKATALFDRAIAIAQKDAKSTVMMKASTLYAVSAVYHYGGRQDLAKPLMKRVVDMYTAEIARLEKTAPGDPQLTGMLGQLGYIYRQDGDFTNAEKTFMKAIAIARRTHGFSGWEASLADIKRAQGKPEEALALLEHAQRSLTKISPRSATAYNTQIADVLREMGEYKRAEEKLLAYRAHAAKTYGKRHPIYGMAMLSLSFVYMASGKIAQAARTLDESLESAERELALVLETGTESDHALYFARNSYQLDTAINFHLKYAPKSMPAARLALTTLLRRKGRVLDAAATSLATIRSKLSPADKKLLDELASTRAQLAKLTVAGPAATGEADYAKAIAALENQIQRLEIQVGKKSAAYRVVRQPVVLPAIQKMIPRDARLVEIVNFQPGDAKRVYQIGAKLPARHYAAYVLARKGQPALVDLGEVGPIDRAVESFRKAVSDPDNDRAADLGRALYDLTMAKIVPRLGGATNILIAPDGTLNVVPFSALVDDQGQFLIKRFTFTYLTSGRDLLRLDARTKAQGGGVIFADPSFDGAKAPRPAAGPPGSRGRRSADLATRSWSPLPGTGAEADALKKTWPGIKVYRGPDATENRLKSVHGPRILHLATHGFFLADEPQVAAAPADAGGNRAAGPPAPFAQNLPSTSASEHPLLRSGLAFAGANKLSSGVEDGILTAMEASGLDLWGTKLVVLSACETGVGKVTNGEGVYGLRRALVIAGAQSLVMTLWQVDDFATKELMAGYYEKLKAGRGRSSALRDLQLELQARDKYAHPYYWASFLPTGNNSPLRD